MLFENNGSGLKSVHRIEENKKEKEKGKKYIHVLLKKEKRNEKGE